jgi:hypothetical protein
MNEDLGAQGSSDARKLAIIGALITGVAGIVMAVYSVVGGAEAAGGALLAGSALAFGLLAVNVDRVANRLPSAGFGTPSDPPHSGDIDGEGASQRRSL